jgi:quercetin dioxygenase-like cupin family protein
MPEEVIVRKPDEGTAYWMLGGLYEVKASGSETGGAATIMEMTLPAGSGPPPHTHPGSESVYVLEGQLRYNINGEDFEGGPGSFFHIPKGVVENFEPAGDSPARILVVYTPGGIDQFFAEVGEIATTRAIPPPLEEAPDLETVAAAGAKYGMDIQIPGH